MDRNLKSAASGPRAKKLGLVIAGDETRLGPAADPVWRVMGFEKRAGDVAGRGFAERHGESARRQGGRARGAA